MTLVSYISCPIFVPIFIHSCDIFQDIPHQQNNFDCGVFALKFAEYITRRAEITFTQVREVIINVNSILCLPGTYCIYLHPSPGYSSSSGSCSSSSSSSSSGAGGDGGGSSRSSSSSSRNRNKSWNRNRNRGSSSGSGSSMEENLVITNSVFNHKDVQPVTWMHPRSNHWHLLDYIITNHQDLADVLDTGALRH